MQFDPLQWYLIWARENNKAMSPVPRTRAYPAYYLAVYCCWLRDYGKA